MRVVQIIDTLRFGGAQKMQIALAQAMHNRSVELTVLSLADNVSNTPIPDRLQALGARVFFFPADSLLNPGRIWRITRFLRRQRFDIVHTHLTYANIIGTIAGRLAGIPVIASLRNSSVERNPVRRGLETWLLRYWAKRVMAVGHATAEFHQARLRGQQIRGIPSGVTVMPPLPPAERVALRRQLIGDPDRPLLISVGRLTPQKGYSYLLTAFAELRQTYPEAALIIAGDGQLAGELTAQIAALNLGDNVALLGARSDVPRLLAASDLFVSSSLWEGLSVAVLEAMAAGLPVVATNVSDTPRVVVEGTGLIVPPQNPAALATALRLMLDDPARRQSFGAAAQTHVACNHNATDWAEKILTLYAEIIRSPSSLALQEIL